MNLSNNQFQFLLGCVRHCATEFEDKARANDRIGTPAAKDLARAQFEFAKQCAGLAIHMDAEFNQRTPAVKLSPGGLILPK